VTTDDTIYVYPKATDPDSDFVSFSYAWTCNGDDVGWNTAQLEGWQYFSKGDEIQGVRLFRVRHRLLDSA
jgi:hypothetical protein